MKADVTIICVAYGNKYKSFVEGWWESIEKLEIRPTEILIVHDSRDDTGVKDLPVRLVESAERDITSMLNKGFSLADTKWLGVLSLDDRYLPDALNDIEIAKSNFDIIGVNALSMSTGNFLRSDLDKLGSGNNHMLGSSFFTSEIYYRVGGWPSIFWSDWGFWWKCYKADARFCNPPRTHLIIDDVSNDRISSKKNSRADEEIINFMRREV
jgi:hypothetical protein